jgi:deazaflavin-dependent oxidoreductase (nitroreductase family)
MTNDHAVAATPLTPALAAEQFCYLETTGRVTGRSHTVEMWFALGEDGATIYCLSGGGDRSDWVRNIRAEPALRVRIGGVTVPATGRIVLGEPDEPVARRALAAKYYGWHDGPLPNEWSRTALPVAIRLADSPGCNAAQPAQGASEPQRS